MKALSVRQPWAWLITHPGKRNKPIQDIENREWATHIRGRVMVHAGRVVDMQGLGWIRTNNVVSPAVLEKLEHLCHRWQRAGVVGEVDIVDCVRESKSPWFTGPFGFVLSHPHAYKKPILLPGRPGFFDLTLDEREKTNGKQEPRPAAPAHRENKRKRSPPKRIRAKARQRPKGKHQVLPAGGNADTAKKKPEAARSVARPVGKVPAAGRISQEIDKIGTALKAIARLLKNY